MTDDVQSARPDETPDDAEQNGGSEVMPEPEAVPDGPPVSFDADLTDVPRDEGEPSFVALSDDVVADMLDEDEPPYVAESPTEADSVVWPVIYGDPLPEDETVDAREAEFASHPQIVEPPVDDEATTDGEPAAAEVAMDALPLEVSRDGLFGRWIARPKYAKRLRELNQAITTYPESPSNYVVRAELYLKVGEYAQAVADFQQALALAETQIESSSWGLVAQAVQDRARVGLTQAQRRLQRLYRER
jgi:tetratricopeptide (TPR) repeat protein